MLRARIIPLLLINDGALVKTVKFANEKYIGDPINAVRIFNDKAVDELMLLDINASKFNKKPNFDLLRDIASEAFIPISYGGGVTTISDFEQLFKIGIEKVLINSAVAEDLTLIQEASNIFGSQSVVVGIDVRKSLFGRYERYILGGSVNTKESPADFAMRVESAGAGEIVLNNIDKDGTFQGYDLQLIKSVASSIRIPVIATGGASSLLDMASAISIGGAASAAAGSIFVFLGKFRTVLITYPDEALVEEALHSV
jgi:cyclase